MGSLSVSVKKLMDCYLRFYLFRQFCAAWSDRVLTPLPVHIPHPRRSDVDKVARIVASARRPLLIMGSQAMNPPVKPKELADIVKVRLVNGFYALSLC